jgi:hypothetical protein
MFRNTHGPGRIEFKKNNLKLEIEEADYPNKA